MEQRNKGTMEQRNKVIKEQRKKATQEQRNKATKAQLFQSFFPITDIATYRLNLPRGQFI